MTEPPLQARRLRECGVPERTLVSPTHTDDTSVPNGLARAMADAARFLNTPSENVDTVLARLADVASRTIPDVDFASITVATRDAITTKAATDDIALQLDRVQYDLQEGPCVDALLDADKGEVVVNDMAHDQRWPRYGPAAAERGVRSQMGIQIYREGRRSAGGLNLYSNRTNAFTGETRAAAEIFAVHAAVAMDKVRVVTSLTEALASRQLIGQAVGIVMQTYTINENAAFNYLTRVSQTSNVKLREIAAGIVAAAAAEADTK